MSEKRAVIFVNGLLADGAAVLAEVRSSDTLIAADGGLHILLSLGLMPDLLLGDLDSINPAELAEMQAAGVDIRRYPPEKDETDLELALLVAVEAGFRSIWLVAALGGRLDQTLANLFLLMLPQLSGLQVRLFDGREEVCLVRRQAEIHGEPGEIVSLLPLNGPAIGVTTDGLLYPLRGETLYPQHSRGISNRLVADTARVQVETGLLLCIHTSGSSGSVPPPSQ